MFNKLLSFKKMFKLKYLKKYLDDLLLLNNNTICFYETYEYIVVQHMVLLTTTYFLKFNEF